MAQSLQKLCISFTWFINKQIKWKFSCNHVLISCWYFLAIKEKQKYIIKIIKRSHMSHDMSFYQVRGVTNNDSKHYHYAIKQGCIVLGSDL